MRNAIIALAIALATPAIAHSHSFDWRVAQFYGSITERNGEELNCKPSVCVSRAASFGLRFDQRTFAVCDDKVKLCASPN